MKNKVRDKVLVILFILIGVCTCISISYAYFVVSGSNNANLNVSVSAPNCASVTITNATSITLNNEYAVPLSDKKALSSDVYRTSFTVNNGCSKDENLSILIVPSKNSNMPVEALKYVLVEQSETIPSSGSLINKKMDLSTGTKNELLSKMGSNYEVSTGYQLKEVTLTKNTQKNYYLYLWIDENEGSLGSGATMNTALVSTLVLGKGSLGTEIVPLYSTIAQRYENNDNYVGLYTGEESDTYQNKVYYFKDDVQNNNVLFGDFCWKIVRTTETGGVKLIYNGNPYKSSDYTLLNQSEYTNLVNSSTYSYTFDETNKTWTSTNTGTNNSEISFSAPSNGNYVLNYDLSVYDWDNFIYIEIFKNNEVLAKNTGVKIGQIFFKDLSVSDVIKVVFTRKFSYTSESRNNIIFSFGKVNSFVKSCNNTGTDSQIGTSKFNSSGDSPAYVGYMYNNAYTASDEEILNSSNFSGTKAYGDGVTYASGKYTLTNATTLSVSSSNINTLVGKYTCDSSSTTGTCSSVWYIVSTSDSYIYYYLLSGGTTDGTTKSQNYVFGSSFTYANGSYSLTGTTTINSDNWLSQSSNVNTHHYTCLSSENTCTSLYYVYYISHGTANYITLTSGKSVEDAINEMLYNDDVNTKDSTIKNIIDNWYKNNMTSYTEKLEDTVFCNDRSINNLGGWNPNGGSATTSFLGFKYSSIPSNPSLKCTTARDKFTVESSNGNGKLTYPVGLLTVPEAKLANYESGNYLSNGQYFWLGSPSLFLSYSASFWAVDSSYFRTLSVSDSLGVRPVISLKQGTGYTSGDGSYTSPFVIE